jgi:hypothetical protein
MTECEYNCPRCSGNQCKYHWDHQFRSIKNPEDICAGGIEYGYADCEYCMIECRNRIMSPFSSKSPYHTNMGPANIIMQKARYFNRGAIRTMDYFLGLKKVGGI